MRVSLHCYLLLVLFYIIYYPAHASLDPVLQKKLMVSEEQKNKAARKAYEMYSNAHSKYSATRTLEQLIALKKTNFIKYCLVESAALHPDNNYNYYTLDLEKNLAITWNNRKHSQKIDCYWHLGGTIGAW